MASEQGSYLLACTLGLVLPDYNPFFLTPPSEGRTFWDKRNISALRLFFTTNLEKEKTLLLQTSKHIRKRKTSGTWEAYCRTSRSLYNCIQRYDIADGNQSIPSLFSHPTAPLPPSPPPCSTTSTSSGRPRPHNPIWSAPSNSASP